MAANLTGEPTMNSNGGWHFDRRSSAEQKKDWVVSKTASLIKAGHTRQFSRGEAKRLYRELSRY